MANNARIGLRCGNIADGNATPILSLDNKIMALNLCYCSIFLRLTII